MKGSPILTVDAAVNLGLGVLLMLFPRDLLSILGVPVPSSSFYPSILGVVLAGIGLALLLQRFPGSSRLTGLGIEGAIAINMCGAGMLVAWLIHGKLDIPSHGYAFLWAVVLVVLSVGGLEILLRSAQDGGKWSA